MRMVAPRLGGWLLGLVGAVTLVSDALAERRTAIVDAIAKTKGAVVNIQTLRNIPAKLENADSSGRVKGLGTGVFIDPRGYIVTNHHVVANVDKIDVVTSDRQSYEARVLRVDEKADLAILKVDEKRLFAFLPLWDSGELMLGETVIAIGNPYGLENSVTVGIVSAIDRELRLPNGEMFDDLIQTNASINPGNSGGPLLNADGELVGINVAIRTNAQGIAFAIPTRKVRQMVENMMGRRRESLRHHGLVVAEDGLRPASESAAAAPTEEMLVRVSHVERDSKAYKVGFRPGDVIVGVSDQRVRMPFDLDRALWDRRPGEKLTFRVRRDGKDVTVTLDLGEPSDEELVWLALGAKIEPVPASAIRAVFPEGTGGVKLLEVAPGAAADRAGFRVGDILIGLHDMSMVNANNIRYVIEWKELAKHQPIEYHIIRGGKILKGRFHLPSAP